MIGILHRYVLRELLKTFVLTSIGLTLMFAMGGGLLNLIRIEQISPSDVARLLLWFIPLVASFMLPIAALLSCALVYGRLAADNELDACKASGINILRLMGSAAGLALVVGGISFYLSNFKVPELFQRISEIAQRDLPDMLVARLKEQGHISFKNYMIYADSAHKLEPQDAMRVLGESNPNKQVVLFQGAAYVQYRDEDPVQTGTAEKVLLIFDRSCTPMEILVKLLDVHEFNHNPPRFSTLKDLTIEKAQMPDLPAGRLHLKFLNLWELFQYRQDPASTEALKTKLERFRQKVAGVAMGEDLLHSLVQKGEGTLEGKEGQVHVHLKGECKSDLEGRQAKVLLRGNVRVEQTLRGKTRIYWARQADLAIQPVQDGMTVNIVLRDNVKLLDPAQTREAIAQSSPFVVPMITVPLQTLQEQNVPTSQKVLDRAITMQIPQVLQEEREKLLTGEQDMRRQITAAIHARLSMSISTLVLVMLATALGIALRGGHALTAFAVAFIPTIVVVLMITTGRQLAEQSATAILGLAVMWGILGLVAVLDSIVIFGAIRR